MDSLIFIINFTGMLIWMFPPIRQYGTKFFLFFLAFGFSDWAGLVFNKYIYQNTNHIIYIAATTAAYLSLQNKEHLKKHYLFYSSAAIIAIAALMNGNYYATSVILVLFHALIFIVLCKMFMEYFFQENTVNVFLSVLLFYELTTVMKFGTIFTGLNNNHIYFGSTTAFQILLGLYFIIFRYDFRRMVFQLK